ncbi:MAG: glutamate formimidoyltransferase [Tissierellia bacterium]|nr:glutamate formimidoyltransferase [Tissierellia bacterium]
MKVLMAEVNFSEGTNLDIVKQVRDALMSVEGVTMVDENSDKDHNRSVFTYIGTPEAVLEGTKKLSEKAIELIDMTKHTGSHPRMGAIDVVPFIPVRDVTSEEAVEIAKEYATFLGGLGVPVYYYEDASENPDRKTLPKIRKGQYEALEEKMQDEFWRPDAGPFEFNPKSGATVTGARFPLIAFNVNLNTTDIEVGKAIVKTVRAAAGGFTNVRAIALDIPEKNQVQVSMNLTNYEKTPIHRVLETIKFELTRFNVTIADTELVGPLPVYALKDLLQFYIKVNDDFSVDQIFG